VHFAQNRPTAIHHRDMSIQEMLMSRKLPGVERFRAFLRREHGVTPIP